MSKPPSLPLPSPLNPEEEQAPGLSSPTKGAGGLAAILSSARHVFPAMGPWRAIRGLAGMNQLRGFDCPGCAWPDPSLPRSIFEFCENGAKAFAEEATTDKADAELFEKFSVHELSLRTDHELGQLGRLTEPLVLREGTTHYSSISWNEAFALIASELKALPTPDAATFYTSGRTSNEAAFLYQLFVRLFGTNNLPDCSNMCHESSGVGLTETIGIGKGTVTLEDFDHADCILIIGQNPGTNHPRMLTALQAAARNGCRIVSINPLLEPGIVSFKHPQEYLHWLGAGTPLSSLHLPVRINGDVALFKGLLKELLELGSLDRDFISQYTEGFAEFEEDLRATSWESVTSASGISRELISEAATLLSKSKRVIACWAMGITQHKNAIANVQEIVNLLLLGGHLGRAGAGACPVRGHSNVQGDRTMGISERMPPAFLEALEEEFGIEVPRKHGLDTVDSIRAMIEGKVNVFFGLGGNFLSASPDTEVVAAGLRKCSLTVHVSTKLNRSHLITGRQALILPCLARSDRDGGQFITVENSMGVVHASEGMLEPMAKTMRSEVAIVCDLAEAVFQGTAKAGLVPWSAFAVDYELIRDRIANVVPGFAGFREKARAGFTLPNPVRDSRTFPTASGLAHFTVHPIDGKKLAPGRFLLMTIRSHDQFNTTIYGLDDRYRGISGGRRVVLMNEEDIRELKLEANALVNVTSHFSGETRTGKSFRVVPYQIPRGCLASYFPEANVLVPAESYAEKSQTPTYKSIEVSVSPA